MKGSDMESPDSVDNPFSGEMVTGIWAATSQLWLRLSSFSFRTLPWPSFPVPTLPLVFASRSTQAPGP
jgi:hypothetical protein